LGGLELSPVTARLFPIDLYTHQEQAIAFSTRGESYVVTTGTGSGKSLCFFIPIVDAVLRAKAQDNTPRTRAIVIYPMNALANSQREELIKFIGNDGPVTFARYTGQESKEERDRIKDNPPDILLTNFMMLEMLMTRQNETDSRVIANCTGLQFLVLDELHTYRGRQGADVAMLVRRVRRYRLRHDRQWLRELVRRQDQWNICAGRSPVGRPWNSFGCAGVPYDREHRATACEAGTSSGHGQRGLGRKRSAALSSFAPIAFVTNSPCSCVVDGAGGALGHNSGN
jgi:hypothetical protein